VVESVGWKYLVVAVVVPPLTPVRTSTVPLDARPVTTSTLELLAEVVPLTETLCVCEVDAALLKTNLLVLRPVTTVVVPLEPTPVATSAVPLAEAPV